VVKESILNLLKKIEPLRNFSTLRKPLRKDVFVEYCKVICFEVGVFITPDDYVVQIFGSFLISSILAGYKQCES